MSFSEKQMQILTFPYTSYTSLICDGAVRSGKTSVMSISFLLWAMGNFSGQNFGICGKTVISAERNVIRPLLGVKYLHEHFRLKFANHILTVSRGNKTNTFYVFGGKDESSYMLIQGATLAGVLLDEVALMPESFVNQALARCSVEGSKYWFNCNPEGPQHWFYQEWVLQPENTTPCISTSCWTTTPPSPKPRSRSTTPATPAFSTTGIYWASGWWPKGGYTANLPTTPTPVSCGALFPAWTDNSTFPSTTAP